MKIDVTPELKDVFVETAKVLKGSDRRLFMARVVKSLGHGGQSYAESELGWNRGTVRKGLEELENGVVHADNFAARGRKKAEDHLPNLLQDIRGIVDSQSQTDPTFRTTRLYTRLSANEVRRQLVERKGYAEDKVPCNSTTSTKLNKLGYRLRPVQKSQPKKKIAETDAIFAQLEQEHHATAIDPAILRVSLDAKATVLIGNFSRGGKSRVVVKAVDHDFGPDDKVTPFGIFLPDHDLIFLYFTRSRVTSDFIVDCLRDCWQTTSHQFPQVQTLLLNQDNGPENHSRRTQFMKRITEFVDEFQIKVKLAYYPPYHSKYNPIERVWGLLEQHWNGTLLDSVDTVLNFARTMRHNGQYPVVKLVEKPYHTGVRLTPKAMKKLEERFERLPKLEKWFVDIDPIPIVHSG